ncbi:hypothetical protein [Actinomadura oligospora]|uniref:SbtR family transcriptional regulator n=1 Tax=Actinomadura oligospora TaxID=111804 RepID=UPI00316ADC7E
MGGDHGVPVVLAQVVEGRDGHRAPAIASLMDACAAAGVIRTDIRPTDLSAALEGIALTSAGAEHREQAERLLDLTLDGLTVRP